MKPIDKGFVHHLLSFSSGGSPFQTFPMGFFSTEGYVSHIYRGCQVRLSGVCEQTHRCICIACYSRRRPPTHLAYCQYGDPHLIPCVTEHQKGQSPRALSSQLQARDMGTACRQTWHRHTPQCQITVQSVWTKAVFMSGKVHFCRHDTRVQLLPCTKARNHSTVYQRRS